MHSHIYHYNDFGEDYEDGGMTYGRRREFANLNPHRRGMFPNSNRRNMISTSIRGQGGGNSNLDEFSNYIPFFDGNIDVESILLWIEKVDKLFDMKYVPMKDRVEIVVHKLKRRAATWWK